MRKTGTLLIFCLLSAGGAIAGENSSAYTKFDLQKTCRQIEKGDEYVFAGSWSCKGYGGINFTVSSADDRDFVGFGKDAGNSCSFGKTFNRFNAALSPI